MAEGGVVSTHYDKDRDNAALGKFYTDHVSAMTREGLHKKSDIASELAVRDARIAELERERNSLRDFANAVMESWPHGDVDGCDLERMAVEHGLLALKDPKPTEPCGDNCACSGYPSPEEWAQGIDCYVRTPLLKGDAARAGNGGGV